MPWAKFEIKGAACHPIVNGRYEWTHMHHDKPVYRHTRNRVWLFADTCEGNNGNWHLSSEVEGGTLYYWAAKTDHFEFDKRVFRVTVTNVLSPAKACKGDSNFVPRRSLHRSSNYISRWHPFEQVIPDGRMRQSNPDLEHKYDFEQKDSLESFDWPPKRCIALVAHNNMKPTMKKFVTDHQELLKKFRLTGTNTTMTMLRSVLGSDDNVNYGPALSSGPLGGDVELCAHLKNDIGAVIFFMDALTAHPHQPDIESVIRLCNVHNVPLATNPQTAELLCIALKKALREVRKDLIPSFFMNLESAVVKNYKEKQANHVRTV